MLATLRNDIRMLLRGISGQAPPYLVHRGTARRYRAAVRPTPMRVVALERRELDLTVWLDNAHERPFEPGQFLTLCAVVEGRRLRRAYSISSPPDAPGRLRLTVRRVPDGAMSNHLNDTVEVGDTIEVLGPSGRFIWKPETGRALLAIAGGSGLTPLMAMFYAALEHGAVPIHLIYANRSPTSGLYRDELDALSDEHPQFSVTHVIGDLTPADLDACPFEPSETDAYLCGPSGLMAAARKHLMEAGVAAERIASERFHSPAGPESREPRINTPQSVSIQGPTRAWTCRTTPGETILEAGLRGGAALPFSCAMGGCGACRVRLQSGSVVMDEPHCLTAEERQDGVILTCVARALEPCVIAVNSDSEDIG